VDKYSTQKLAGKISSHIFATPFKIEVSSSQNKLKFTPKAEKKSAKKFGRNIQALTFALHLKNGWQTRPEDL
jgi:hypothetical protein